MGLTEIILIVVFIALAINVQRIKTNQRIASSEYESLLEAIHNVEGRVDYIIDNTIDKVDLDDD